MSVDNSYIPVWLSARTARWLAMVFLIFGVQCWLVVGEGNFGHAEKLLFLLAAILAGFVPPVSRTFDRAWHRLARPTRFARRVIAMGIWTGSGLFIYLTEVFQGTRFQPMFADEFSYLIQMRMLARGRLWMPAIGQPAFFDSFYLLVSPKYASMYFPGMALMYFPSLLLHVPYVVFTLAAAGGCAALMYLILSEVLDGAAAILGVVLLLSLSVFRLMSIMLMAQIPMLLLGLLMTWAYLKWRSDRRSGWLLLMGAAAGWGAITRPVDALGFAVVLLGVMAMDLRGKPWRECSSAVVWMAAPIVPFLILQIVINVNVTGGWMTTPFGRYNDLNYPGAFGFHSGEAVHVSAVPEVRAFYETAVKPLIERHRIGNLPDLLLSEMDAIRRVAVVDPLMFVILPISLLAMWRRRFAAVWGMVVIFPVLMSWSAFSVDLQHYFVMVMPAVILLSLLPIGFLAEAFPKRSAGIRTSLTLAILVMALAAMPELNRLVHDQYPATPELDRINAALAKNVSGPAVVMFHFDSKASVVEEPVFNSDVAWPDDAPVIRARDLNRDVSAIGGPRDLDRPLYAYYLQARPDRVFYVYDRGTGRLARLGTASELLAERTANDGR